MEVFSLRKTRTIIFLCVFFVMSATIGVFAADTIKKVEAYLRSDFQVFLNGDKVDVGPVLIYENRSYLPLRTVGELVDAEVVWNEENKGIYINQRYHGQPVPIGSDKEEDYEKIELNAVSVLHFTYLGKDRSVVVNREGYGKVYYRVWDLNLMGIDTEGLVKTRDPFTGHLFVEEKELSQVWQPPTNYRYKDVEIPEKNEEKAEVIKSFIKSIPYKNAQARDEDPLPYIEYYYPVTVYAIDALPDDEYNILTLEDGQLCWYTVKLKLSREDRWYQSGYQKSTKELNYYRY